MLGSFMAVIYNYADKISLVQVIVAWVTLGLAWLSLVYLDAKKNLAILLACLMALPNGELNAKEGETLKTEEGIGVGVGVGVAVLILGGLFVVWYYGKCKKLKENPPKKREVEKMLEEMGKGKGDSDGPTTYTASKSGGVQSCVSLANPEDEGVSLILSLKIQNGLPRIYNVETVSSDDQVSSFSEVYKRLQSLGIPPEQHSEHHAKNFEPIDREESPILFEDGQVIIKGFDQKEVTIEFSEDLETWQVVQTLTFPSNMVGQIWVNGRHAKSFWRVK